MNSGIGTTDEYFGYYYKVPSWTLETEPTGGQSYHAPLPGGGADYGGTGENGHDGFILPDSEIRRVREELAQSFAAVFYRQAGPPAIRAMRLIDTANGAVVYESEWDPQDNVSRSLYRQQLQALQINRSYDLWLAFDKPMRWREEEQVVPFPGQPESTLDLDASIQVNQTEMNALVEGGDWLDQPGGAPDGYVNYRDDALKITFNFPDDEHNQNLVNGETQALISIRSTDMTGMNTDANPATVADWANGAWRRYEDDQGNETDSGGFDSTHTLAVTDQTLPPPFLVEAGTTSSWYDPAHDGEGFLLEILSSVTAVMYWYSYDSQGAQDWYVAQGEIRGNRIVFPDLLRVTGGEFGPGFDPTKISEQAVGSVSFIWSGCDKGDMSYQIGTQRGRMQLTRLTRLMGVDCGHPMMPPISEDALLSGSWYDPDHNGEGFNLEVLIDGRAVVYWFSYDPQGNRRWFYGLGENQDGRLIFDNMLTSSGGIFGPDFNPLDVDHTGWGSLVLELDCHGGTASYNSTEAGFGAGTLNLVRLTNIDQLDCP
jgi:hypothetical protein